ncbi:MAG: hypothetical protein ABEJ88_09590 [Halobacterium sp.]
MILDDQDDRVILSIDAAAVAGGLRPGDQVTLSVVTANGEDSRYAVLVPESIEGKDVVTL